MLVGLILGVFFVTPLVLTYLFFIRWADRFEPEPWWLILAAFIWGAVFATLGGGISSSIASSVTKAIFPSKFNFIQPGFPIVHQCKTSRCLSQ